MADLRIILMDAGQGDAILVVFPDESLMLVDCGCKLNADVVSDEIASVLKVYLKATKNVLKALILTHSDGDHYNLVKKLLVDNGVKIGVTICGGKLSDYKGLGIPGGPTVLELSHQYFDPGIDTDLSFTGSSGLPDVDIRILAANMGGPKPNDQSIVLLLTCGKINIFLMGDAETKTEEFLIKKINKNPTLKAVITKGTTTLKVGHHGSLTSSSPDWLDYIKPETALISSDTKSFGGVSLPRSEVINRLIPAYVHDAKNIAQSHYYVQYDTGTDNHEQVNTTAWLFTTLHLIKSTGKKNAQGKKTFTAYGTSWYYSTDGKAENCWPACGWTDVNKSY